MEKPWRNSCFHSANLFMGSHHIGETKMKTRSPTPAHHLNSLMNSVMMPPIAMGALVPQHDLVIPIGELQRAVVDDVDDAGSAAEITQRAAQREVAGPERVRTCDTQLLLRPALDRQLTFELVVE